MTDRPTFGRSPELLHRGSKTWWAAIVRVDETSDTITINDQGINTVEFLDVIRDLDEPVIDQWQLRALERAMFMDR